MVGLLCYVCWPPRFSVVPKHGALALFTGAVVFALWIGPDLLFPHHRSGWLFTNAFVAPPYVRATHSDIVNPWFLLFRTIRATAIVPVVEEIFWRGWLMRWLIRPDFENVQFGAYRPAAFWITAVLFASEHGAYWDVGLLAGVVYNLFAIRSRSLSASILAHSITNGLLCAYVIGSGQWQYWG